MQNKNIQLRHYSSNEPILQDEMELIGKKGPLQALTCIDYESREECADHLIDKANLVSLESLTRLYLDCARGCDRGPSQRGEERFEEV